MNIVWDVISILLAIASAFMLVYVASRLFAIAWHKTKNEYNRGLYNHVEPEEPTSHEEDKNGNKT